MNKLSSAPIVEKNGKYYRNNNEVIKLFCPICNAPIYRQPWYLKKYSYKSFCSEKCKQISRDPKGSKIMKSKNTSNFNYLIGLICTDGHLGKLKNVGNYIEIRLAVKDQSSVRLLNRIQNVFGGKVQKDGLGYVWSIYNSDFYSFLLSIGLTHKKSLNLNVTNYFNKLTKKNKYHFLRGVIDGDGYIGIDKKLNGTLTISSGSKKFLEMLEQFLGDNIYIHKLKNQNCYQLNIYCSHITKKCKPIYKNLTDTDLYLERKYERYKKIEKLY